MKWRCTYCYSYIDVPEKIQVESEENPYVSLAVTKWIKMHPHKRPDNSICDLKELSEMWRPESKAAALVGDYKRVSMLVSSMPKRELLR